MDFISYCKQVAPHVGSDVSVHAANLSNLENVPDELAAIVALYLAAEERLIVELKTRKIITP